jgi:hypothetical protein
VPAGKEKGKEPSTPRTAIRALSREVSRERPACSALGDRGYQIV